MKRTIVPLTMLPPGASGVIVDIESTGRGFMRRLGDMGLYYGSEIKVVSSTGLGPILIQVKDCTMAIGRGVARRILVARKV